MRGLVVPEATEDFTADPVELFFDLAFVFAFSQIVGLLLVRTDLEHRREGDTDLPAAVAAMVAVRVVGQRRARQLPHGPAAVPRRNRGERADGGVRDHGVRPEWRPLRDSAGNHLPHGTGNDGGRARQRLRGLPISRAVRRTESCSDDDHRRPADSSMAMPARSPGSSAWRSSSSRRFERAAASGSSAPATSPNGTR